MSYKDNFNVFVGAKSGTFKGVKVTSKSCVMKNIQNLLSITDNHEVTYMTWGNSEEKDILLACGSKGIRSVKVYDTVNETFKLSFVCDIGEGNITGISRYKEEILTAVQSGHIKLWRNNEEDKEYILNAGENLLCMKKANVRSNIIGTGGLENPLKLFDLEKKISIFTAKNVSHDWLQLRVPISINDLHFLSNNKEIVTVGKYGFIRVYDTKAQRRPVINLEIKEESLTKISTCSQDKQIICGSGKGRINMVDLRKCGRVLNTYKGPVGAVTGVAVNKTDQYIVSANLDRYLYIHDLNTKALLKKVYLTSKLSSMVMRSEFTLNVLEEDNQSNDDDEFESEHEFINIDDSN
ncbi:PREDICTED: WD repeat-containing protein 74 [Ceratosolen solmsi marchali]|uniref:WD repeat-containing protein 74 n=1 Tax=Ceratosolen solmsi marchali TaxID=326594 RepID=A0AAJ6YSG0_9HYME|nr:PREDICTED: WD repeat-containing protein 74 [Ceratosolen solmsi marchali]